VREGRVLPAIDREGRPERRRVAQAPPRRADRCGACEAIPRGEPRENHGDEYPVVKRLEEAGAGARRVASCGGRLGRLLGRGEA